MRFRDAPPCSEWGPGDGKDPRYDTHANPPKLNRKALQLCSQVQHILSLAIAECADNCLQSIQIESVSPAPDSLHLLVVVRSPLSEGEVLAGLERVNPWLRSEIAAGIHRKKTPQIKFAVR